MCKGKKRGRRCMCKGKGGRRWMCKGEGGKEMDVCKGEGGKVYLLFHLYLSSFHLVFSFLVDK